MRPAAARPRRIKELIRMEQGPIWDTLILDEVQDLARESYLDVLDTLLEAA